MLQVPGSARVVRAVCVFAITAGVGAGVGPASALPALGAAQPPRAVAVDTRLFYVNQPGSVDATLDGTFAGTRAWRGEILNLNGPASPTIPGTHIQVDSASPAWNWSGTPPTFPIDEVTGDVAADSRVQMTRLDQGPGDAHAWIDNTPVSTGYDSARTQAPAAIPDGGGVQQDTVSVTLRNPTWDYAEIDIFTHEPNQAQVVPAEIVAASIVTPVLANGEALAPKPGPQPDRFEWAIVKAMPGVTYTISYDVRVGKGGSFKPFVTVRGGTSTPEPAVTGNAIDISDPELGGTFSFTSADPTTEWSGSINDVVSTNYALVVPVPDYDVSLDSSEYTVRAGGTFSPVLTLTPLNGFSAIVESRLCSGSAGNQPPLPGFRQTAPYPPTAVGPGTASVTIPITTSETLAPGDYTVGVCTVARGVRVPNKIVTLTVHVTAPVGRAHASAFRTWSATFPAPIDSVVPGVFTGDLWFSAVLRNAGSSDIPNPSITASDSLLGFTPPQAFPSRVEAPDLTPGAFLMHGLLTPPDARVAGAAVEPGFDVSRSMSATTIPAGGGVETVTATVTARDPALAHQSLLLMSQTDVGIGAVIVPDSVLLPTLTHGEVLQFESTDATSTQVSLGNVALDVPYTVTYQVRVPNTGAAPLSYKPFVLAQDFTSRSLPPVPASPTAEFADSVLGGTWTFAAGASVDWQLRVLDRTAVFLDPEAVSTAPVSRFAVRVVRPATAGSPVRFTVTALDAANARVPSFAGPVALSDAAGGAFSTVSWSRGVGTGTLTVDRAFRDDRIQVTDTSTGNAEATGQSGAFQVYGPLVAFKLAATPTYAAVATPLAITAWALDDVGHVIPTYTGTDATLTDTLGSGSVGLPALAWVKGVGRGTATFSAPVRADKIVITDGAVTTTSGAFTRYGDLASFGLTVTPRSAPVGTTVTVRVRALDVNGSLVKGYPGGATLSDTQGAVDWPVPTFVDGIAIVTFTFGGPVRGDRITVTDGPVSATSGPVNAL